MKTSSRLSSLGCACLLLGMPLAQAQVNITTDTYVGAGDNSLEAQEVIVDHATLTVAGPHTLAGLQLLNGAVLTHEPAPAGEPENALRLSVTGNVLIDATSRIDASGKGYAQADAPGAGTMGNYAGGGGGHGGHGHRSAGIPGPGGAPYGSIVAPDEWGGPGANSTATSAWVPGGGLIHLEVTGTVTLDGAIRADGASAWIDNQGGGAGGTVSVKAGTLAGAGAISANGGSGEWVEGGGGSGGRVALILANPQFTGSLSAAGAGGAGIGGAGTIYVKPGAAPGEVSVVNGGRGEWTPLTAPVPFDLVLGGNAIVYPTEPLTLGSLTVGGTALLTHATGNTGLVVNASGNVTIAADAAMSVDGRGYPFGGERGPGTGTRGDWSGSGAGHGGMGGRGATGSTGGVNYGSVLQPTGLGSQGGDGNGGPGSAGGGAIRLVVTGTLTVAGRLSAAGIDNRTDNAGGGSGGSIWINAGTLTGGGVIVANGGAGEWIEGGGGSGGRIALYFANNQFSGPITARGGGGSQKGGAGTVYLKRAAEPVGELVVDNGGWGNYTPITSPEAFRLTISGNAVCYPEAPLTVARLTMPNEAVLTHLTGQSNIALHVTGDATIAAGAQLTADGRGYPIGAERGPGAGTQSDWSGSGGGHGGLGGISRTGAAGGGHYDSVQEPTLLGSQGGNSPAGPGTPGGGAIRMVVDGRLALEGRLSANGGANPPDNVGGGSGGSIWLTVGSLSGAGVIAADGGPGEWIEGGGGGGGRIAIYYDTKDFTGPITTFGGSGNQRAGAGTVYLKQALEAEGELVVDNGGAWGNYTPLTSPGAPRATLRGRAVSYPESALTFARLDVIGESVLTHLTGQSNINVHVRGDLFVGTGSEITTEGRGYPIGEDRGPGSGTRLDWSGSGAGHGGLGGWGRTGAVPGADYGSMLEPVALGSQGGNASGGPGTAGGGAVRLVVDGTLTVDGSIDANGAVSPPDNTGGGSGGSVWLTVGTLAGNGAITANGGPGEWIEGGGGAGGRIAFYYRANTFTGAVTAYGGSGNQRGGAGTIYTRKQGSAFGQLLVHNGGAWGNYTPLTSPEAFQLTLAEMAYVYPVQPLTLRDLEVRTNTVLTHLTGQARCEVTVLNNALIAEGGAISVDGRGYSVAIDPGPGAGVRLDCCGSGGGHGGTGGRSASGALGGSPYGSVTEPLEHGSAGGSGSGGAGAAGGGVVRLNVANLLTIDGRVSAQGLAGTIDNIGGGAGGSIYFTAKTIAGKGAILADGGSGEWVDGGGGAGGRIALYADTLSFAGDLAARGAGGRERGGAGSIYTKLTGATTGDLVLDNGGNAGALTPFDVPPNTRLVLGSGSVFYPIGPVQLVSLRLKPGATLTHITGQSNLTIAVTGDLVVESGATITANGKGYPVGGDPGPGAGGAVGCCGGGGAYGGNGGVSASGSAGGQAYGSVLEPTELGSSGGGGNGSTARSPGGGAVRLVVGGTLQLDGTLAANGVASWYDNQGGAAGGSIWVTAERLAGTGLVSANGGNGEWVDAGSGSGGRIAFYLGANEFTGTLSASGGPPGRQAGGAGTIYTKLTSETVGRVLIDNGDVWGAYTPLVSDESFRLTIARRAQVYGDPDLTLSSLTVETNTVLTHLKGQEALKVVVVGDATIAGAVNVDGRGYPVGADPGPGAGGRADWAGSGAGHGGLGGTSRTGLSGGQPYGSRLEPTLRGSQGGGGSGGPGGDGGGAVRFIVGGTLTLDGSIGASGLNGTPENAGGGSGGSVFISTRSLAGAGSITANGGAGEWVDGGGGSGGRIALYRTASTFTGTLAVSGAGGSARGEEGTIHEDATPSVLWLSPSDEWVDGAIPLEVAVLSGESGAMTAEFSAWRNNQSTLIATVPSTLTAATTWDTTRVTDGAWELRVVVRTAAGATVAESKRSVTVNNSVAWHGGQLTAAETWLPGRVHVVRRELVIPAGLALTLEPGTIVKFLPGTRLLVQSGGTLNALGTEPSACVLTSFLDDTEGGDSNLDGAITRPAPGAWRFVVTAGATLNFNERTRLRYHVQSFGGTLAANERWGADSLHVITAPVIVPDGVTLALDGGAIVKLGRAQGITVRPGGKLIALGSLAAPVVFTSDKDDNWGGDTNEDGSQTKPAAGDWGTLHAEGLVDLTHTHLLYGAGTSSGSYEWGAGALRTSGAGVLRMVNSLIRDAAFEGIHATSGGSIGVTNSIIAGTERALNADGAVATLVNCTLYRNRIGLWPHGGSIRAYNTIISHSIDTGIVGADDVRYCLVWSATGSNGAFQPGSNGNVSAEPKYQDPAADNFRLAYVSPGIDAGDGVLAPPTDYAGLGRYDDPRTGNTGTPAANGAMPDLGAFEFAESAPSNIDLAVTDVSGPAQLQAGDLVRVEWTVVNRGAEPFSGPWHDAVYLRAASSGQRVFVAEPVVGRALTLAPGQSYRAGADVRVPGGVVAEYQWTVVGNSRGDIFEGANTGNNEVAAASASALTLPVLPLDGSTVPGAFNGAEEQHWYVCSAPAGRDVRFALDLKSAAGVSELYVGRGFVPTPETFTARHREWGASDTTAIVASAGESSGPETTNVLYVLAIGRVLASLPEPFSIGAVTADFALERVLPGTVGNAGFVTLEIRGSGLRTNTVFALRQGPDQRVAIRQSVRETGRAFATFDLTDFPAGKADVMASFEGLTVTLAQAVDVVAGGTDDFYVTLSGPSKTRAGRVMSWFVTYGNRGIIDLPLPLLRFRAPGATEIQLYESTLNWTDSFTFWGLNPEVLLPTLGPGQEVTFEVRVKTAVSGTITVEVMPGEEFAANPTSMGWTTIPAPSGADPAGWAALLDSLNDRLGATLGEYAALLERDLTNLAASPFRYSYLANINGRWILGDERRGIATASPIVTVPEDYQEPDSGAGRAVGLHGRKAGDGIRKTWWLVVTLEDYEYRNGNKDGNLPGCTKDAADLYDYATKDLRTPNDQYFWAHDRPDDAERVTRSTLLDGIRSLKGKVDADDNLVIVYSGHGGRKPSGAPYLVFNGDNASPVAFTEAIDEVGAGTTYFVNNSCHSEGFNELVQPSQTTFVGLAATKKERIAWSDEDSGGVLISNLKGQLRRCRSLGRSFEVATDLIAKEYEDQTDPKHRQHPVLTNPSNTSLGGKPWNDPAGIEQQFDAIFRSPPFPGVFGFSPYIVVGSQDPNDKYALAGVGPERWVTPQTVLPFEVVFENKSSAEAPAQEVLVTDDLDPNLDWSTFELKTIAFNDARLTVPPGLQQYSTTTTVSTDPNDVTVEVGLNPYTGRITWLLRSRDPFTGDLPEDPYAGFLPPNDATHRGEGSLTFTVRPKPGLPDRTQLRNYATITFDPTYGANPPILTPTVTNTVDTAAPASQVESLPTSATGSVSLRWAGQDAAGSSGLASYDVYVARDPGPFGVWLSATTATSATFAGDPGLTYRFYSVARDAAGNTELAPAVPDAVTTFEGGSTFARWVQAQGLPPNASGPNDDPDLDGLPNSAEYGLAANPMVPDWPAVAPRAAVARLADVDYLALTYRRPKTEPSDLQYRVTASNQAVPWTGVSTVTPVGSPVDHGTYVEVTVRSLTPMRTNPRGFLQLQLRR